MIMIETYYNDASSIVNDGIGGVLFLLKKILQAWKTLKAHGQIKKTVLLCA